MGPSRALVAGGLRAFPRATWRTGIDAAVASVMSQPELWLAGALGFLLRGGIFVLLLPVLVMPTPIEVRNFLGAGLGSAGFSPALVQAAMVGGAIALALVMAGLAVLAWAELTAFERVVSDAEMAAQRDGREVVKLKGRARRRLLVDLFAIQWAAFALLALITIPLVLAAFDVTYREIMRPTGGAALYTRVIGGLGQPLFLLGAGLVVVEVMAAAASRSLLARRLLSRSPGDDAQSGESLLRIIAAGLRTLATAVLGWSVTLALVVPSLWATSLIWQQVRTSLLVPGATDMSVTAMVMVFLLAAAWLAGVVLAGFASALRSALWSVESLR